MNVSILILLDSLLLSFPPLTNDLENTVFQSLFYWILFFYELYDKLGGKAPDTFQSLFYWILFFYKEKFCIPHQL